MEYFDMFYLYLQFLILFTFKHNKNHCTNTTQTHEIIVNVLIISWSEKNTEKKKRTDCIMRSNEWWFVVFVSFFFVLFCLLVWWSFFCGVLLFCMFVFFCWFFRDEFFLFVQFCFVSNGVLTVLVFFIISLLILLCFVCVVLQFFVFFQTGCDFIFWDSIFLFRFCLCYFEASGDKTWSVAKEVVKVSGATQIKNLKKEKVMNIAVIILIKLLMTKMVVLLMLNQLHEVTVLIGTLVDNSKRYICGGVKKNINATFHDMSCEI